MSRDVILERLRAIERSRAAHADPAPSSSGAPPSLRSSGAEALQRFRIEAMRKGVRLLEADEAAEVPALVARYLAHIAEPSRHIRSARLHGPEFSWQETGIAVGGGVACDGDRIGLSRGLAGIAETGTVMLASSADNPVTIAFLPDVHLVLLESCAVVGTFEEAMAHLRHACGEEGMPRSVNLISGASRTGDIGGRIVHGAHGPRHLAVILLNKRTGRLEAP